MLMISNTNQASVHFSFSWRSKLHVHYSSFAAIWLEIKTAKILFLFCPQKTSYAVAFWDRIALPLMCLSPVVKVPLIQQLETICHLQIRYIYIIQFTFNSL